MSQGARDSVMIAFRAERVRLLVATDVASRGLDVSQITHVINYDLPDEPEVYVHRIGRTGRVGRDGKAISLVTRREQSKLDAIQRLTGTQIPAWTPPGEEAPEAEAAAPRRRRRRRSEPRAGHRHRCRRQRRRAPTDRPATSAARPPWRPPAPAGRAAAAAAADS